jgi:hypothetical protein
MRRVLLAVAVVAVVAAAPAQAGGPSMLVGAADDSVQQDNLVAAKAKLDLVRLAGFGAVRIVEVWTPGERAPTALEQQRLDAVTGAAMLDAVKVYVVVLNAGSSTTPLSSGDQGDFAAFTVSIARQYPSVTDFMIGNEPNNNRFWLPQFALDGSDAAAVSYESLLATTYDALKAVSPSIDVIGGALGPHGGDKPGTGKPTHSPTTFITDLVAAYKASGRTLPIMDTFDMHPYEDNSSLPPSLEHPKTRTIAIADYTKLTGVLAGFDGTAQPGSTLPIVYGEFGVESQIPPDKASLYTGTEPATTKPVDEATQGRYYHNALALAFCQPNVKTFFVFHAFDEPPLDRYQSGVYYADGTAKMSLPVVQKAIRDISGGVITRCPGFQLTPQAKITYPAGKALARVPLTLKIICNIDCNVYARLAKLPQASTTLAVSAHLIAGMTTQVRFPAHRVAPGLYRITVRLTAPINIGPPAQRQSKPVLIPRQAR